MSETTVVHVNDPDGYDVYIGRGVPRRGLKPSKWANPYGVPPHGREQSIRLYREHITRKIQQDYLAYDLSELRGKRLACWCKPDHACHGDVLAKLADAS